MEIVVTTPVFPYPKRGIYTGIERHIENLVKYLALKNCKVKVVTTFWNGGKSYEKLNNFEIFRVSDATLYLKKSAGFASLNYLTFSLNSILKSLDFENIDVLLLNNQSPFSFLARNKAKLIIGLAHHIDYIKSSRDFFVIPFAYLYSKLTDLDFIIAPSNFTKKQIIDTFNFSKNKIFVIHEGVETSKFNDKVKPIFRDKFRSENIILYVGPLVKTKNVDKLIRVFNLVQKRINAALVIVGKGPEKNNLVKLTKNLGLENKVYFEGFVSDDLLPYYYASCDVFASCSIIEGFGLIFFEAMACGKPVVAFKIASIPEIVGKGGIILEKYSLEEMANKIIELLKNKELYEELRKNAIRIAMEHDWGLIAEAHIKLYSEKLANA